MASMTYILISIVAYSTLVVLPPLLSMSTPLYFLHVIVFSVLAFFACFTHFRTMTTSPGYISGRSSFEVYHGSSSLDTEEVELVEVLDPESPDTSMESLKPIDRGISKGDSSDKTNSADLRIKINSTTSPAKRIEVDNLKKCNKCKAIKPLKTHHCKICQKCIYKMDHHCPWVNNCVGYYNQRHFILFLVYVGVGSAYSLLFHIVSGLYLWNHGGLPKDEKAGVLVVTYMVFFIDLLFSMFSCILLLDQIDFLKENTTTIDKKMNNKFEKRSLTEALSEVFGERKSCRWMCPFKIPGVMKVHERDLVFVNK